MKSTLVTILCSGAGLGFYIPGLILRYQLQQQGIPAEVLVFENLLADGNKESIQKNVEKYQQNFDYAVVATKVPKNITENIDATLVDALVDRWASENRRHFINLSGNWVYVLNDYVRAIGGQVNVSSLYVDTDYSPSWKNMQRYCTETLYNNTDDWLYCNKNKKVYSQILVSPEEPLSYANRERRCVVHGGGWGIGTYRSLLPVLEEQGISLDVVAYKDDDINATVSGRRYYRIKPDWHCWDKNSAGIHEFPLFAEVDGDRPTQYTNREDYHNLYDVTRQAWATISKPGAGTLIDSLSAATPLVMLDCFGKHEKKNAELWHYHGFGIYYEEWEKQNFSLDYLIPYQSRLEKARQQYPNFAGVYVGRMAQ